ncbi:GFA family protein [Phenylobacterium sp.]|uniref:GFA family protein n=2 Tax=Phenylobacterium sp. TaxID=1871053 RepID=UPI003524EA41
MLAAPGIRGNAMTVRTARCACQACEVEVEGEPVSSGLCSCDNCKRRTGAPFGWSVYFHDEQVSRVEGPLAVLDGFGKRWFCSRCGSTIYWRSFGAWRPGQTGFAGGCFADPTLPVPTIAVRCAQGMPWIAYPDGCAVFDDMPRVPPSSAP